jgi:membrane associated rhomboid family serine protease
MFDPYSDDQYTFTKSWTFYIIVITVAMWLLQLVAYPLVDNLLALEPTVALSGHIYQFVTYMFLHSTYTSAGTIYPLHILFNMFVLAIFGFSVEKVLGGKKFLVLYFLSGIGSALFYIAFNGVSTASLIGASGGVFGLLAAYAFLFPKDWVFLFGFFPLPAALLLVFLTLEEMFFGVLGLQPGVANFGHVGGIITGLLVMSWWKWRKRRKEKVYGSRDFKFIWE